MTRDEFEHRILSLWMTTRMPLTRANLQFVTGAPRAKLEKWLDELTADGVVDVDADDEGEMVWGVRGAARATTGPTSPEEVKKLGDLKREVAAASAAGTGLALMKLGSNATHALLARGDGKKSLIASGALSFLFGPLGWLYAGSLKEGAAGGLAWILLWVILPHWTILAPLWLTAMAASGAIGVLYAHKYN
ncbi:MAG TPA: hypothetical protein VGL86_22150, partial [Polyangia bacterium]